MRGGGSEEFGRDIRNGTLDVAFLGLAEASTPQGVAVHQLAQEELVAVVPSTHPLAHGGRIPLADLAEEVFVDFPAGSSGRMQSDLAFGRLGVRRNVSFESTAVDLTLGLVRNGLAIALLSAQVVPDDSALAVVPVLDGPRRVEYLAWDEFNPSPAARAFAELVVRG